MNLPEHLRYSAEHEWVDDSSPVRVGITQHAADALGDVVYVELPEVGDRVTAGAPCGEIESTKSVSDLYAPVTGEVVAVNTAIVGEPGDINADPYAAWLFQVDVESEGVLLSAEEYAAGLD